MQLAQYDIDRRRIGWMGERKCSLAKDAKFGPGNLEDCRPFGLDAFFLRRVVRVLFLPNKFSIFIASGGSQGSEVSGCVTDLSHTDFSAAPRQPDAGWRRLPPL